MSDFQVLYVAPKALTVYQFRRGRLHGAESFVDEPAGHVEFARVLQQNRTFPAGLLADIVEEEFQTETLPHTRWGDRRALIERHLTRRFRTTPFRHASVIGREATGRKDDRVLLSALIHPDALARWLDPVKDHRVPVCAVSSIPWLCASIAGAVGVTTAPSLVVSHQKGIGLRQTFFARGKLHVSRLVPLAAETRDEAVAAMIPDELARTRHYLERLELVDPRDDIHVHLLGDCSCDPGQGFAIEQHDLTALAQRLGLPSHPDTGAEVFWAQAFAARAPTNRYAPPPLRRDFMFHRTEQWLRMGAAGLLSVALLTGADDLLHAAKSTAAARTAEADTAALPDERLPDGADMTPMQVRDAVVTAEGLAALECCTPHALMAVGTILNDFPEVHIDELVWGSAERAPWALDDEPVPTDGPQHIGTYHGVLVRGVIADSRADRHHTSGRLNALEGALNTAAGVISVEVLQEPADARAMLMESTEPDARPPAFAIKLVVGAPTHDS